MERIVDETINALCDWIKEQLKTFDALDSDTILPRMITALAELVSAKAVKGDVINNITTSEDVSRWTREALEEITHPLKAKNDTQQEVQS